MRFMIPRTTAASSGRSTPGDPEADRRWHQVTVPDGLFHHLVQNLLDLQLTDRLEVGACGPSFRDDVALPVRQLADGLGSACIYSENMNHL